MVMVWLLTACKPSPSVNANTEQTYFDIKGYFKSEALKLKNAHPQIQKTVSHNNDTTSHTVTVKDWLTEFSLFIQSDINKPAWKNSYKVVKSETFIIYTAKEKSLRTRRIVIKLAEKDVQWIMIENRVKNELYATYEKLSYFPESHYEIMKNQSVRLLGNNRYYINGQLKH